MPHALIQRIRKPLLFEVFNISNKKTPVQLVHRLKFITVYQAINVADQSYS